MKTALTIAGSDCSGGAGIQADLKTFAAHKVFGMSVITAVVSENTSRVISIENMPENCITDQITAIFEDIKVDAIKIGMLPNEICMKTVAQELQKYHPNNIVIDPVMVAKGGCALMMYNSVKALIDNIIPLADILTPNIPETEAITGINIKTIDDMKIAAKQIYNMGAKNIIIKGGHLDGDAIDILYNGKDYYTYTTERIQTKNTHGTGCTFSSAIASNLANGMNINDAVSNAKGYITNAIKYSLNIGKGHGPTNHLYNFYNLK